MYLLGSGINDEYSTLSSAPRQDVPKFLYSFLDREVFGVRSRFDVHLRQLEVLLDECPKIKVGLVFFCAKYRQYPLRFGFCDGVDKGLRITEEVLRLHLLE